MHKPTTDNRRGRENKNDKAAYIKRLKKMALYDAKAYFDITINEDGTQKNSLKSGKEIDWDIVESVEIAEGKVKLKFPDRSKAMEKYGKVVMEAADDGDISAVFMDEDDATV